MATWSETLAAEADAVARLTRVACRKSCPDFAELWWHPDEFGATFADPAVEFARPERRVVLARVGGELRYYAGTVGIYDPSYEYEMGTLATPGEALRFAEEFLTSAKRLGAIAAVRKVYIPLSGQEHNRSAPAVPAEVGEGR